jgi:hypothetical protein
MAAPGAADQGAAAPSTFTAAAAGGTAETGGSFNPNMLGDQVGGGAVCGPFIATLPDGTKQVLTLGQSGLHFPVGTTFNLPTTLGGILSTPIPAGQPLTARDVALISAHGGLIVNTQLPPCAVFSILAARGAFKITENESPRPQDRVFSTYNFFYNVNGSLNEGLARTDIHREVIGFEKTFLDGNASFGMRLPFVQVQGDVSIADSDVGDLTMIAKYALINDRDTRNVLSTGLVLTVPTGGSFLPAGTPDIHPLLIQPFLGGILNFGDAYLHGFTSIVVPLDSRDVTFLFNDVALGYFLYRTNCSESLLTSVVPTMEFHLTTPLNHHGAMVDPIGSPDILDLTFGVTFGLGKRATLALGGVVPVTGPKPFDFETQAQLNFRF